MCDIIGTITYIIYSYTYNCVTFGYGCVNLIHPQFACKRAATIWFRRTPRFSIAACVRSKRICGICTSVCRLVVLGAALYDYIRIAYTIYTWMKGIIYTICNRVLRRHTLFMAQIKVLEEQKRLCFATRTVYYTKSDDMSLILDKMGVNALTWVCEQIEFDFCDT